MNIDAASIKKEIKDKIVELARGIGEDASPLTEEEIIPETGYLDSASIIELILWYEQRYNLSIKQSDITVDRFGTLNAMANYVLKWAKK